jgi:glycerophosphoryl diester phosphodiesterase
VLFTEKPTVVGHRGFGRGIRGGNRENTVRSCLAAVAAGVTWIEIDTQRTADDKLVLHHDWTAPDGSYIVERTAAEVAEQGIARLEEVLEAVPPEIGIDLDVKTVLTDATCPHTRRTGALLAAALATESLRRRLLVTSFDAGLAASMRPHLPAAAFGLLTWLDFPLNHGIPAGAALGFDVICLHTGSFGPESEGRLAAGDERRRFPPAADAVAVAHDAGLDVLVWCPDPAESVRYAAAGADALCVDDVPGTLKALRA